LTAARCGLDWAKCRSEGVFDVEALGRLARMGFDLASEALRQRQNEQVRIHTELGIDRRNRESVAELQSEIDTQSIVAAKWGNLSAAIGSADGKAFKIIAQQFTLEALLVEANRELSIITPRYSLRMIQESMHFGVVDHDSFGELRPVHTLSGGETFIVSLALALGLSRMAGGELTVESLFIDEGFGTLDADTLRCVMVALSSLHAQGRKVGLITHVDEMKEQIPVRIEVVKMGQGTSRVEVRG
jgi:DNA repair protein SbcC/Rad50